MNKIFGSIQVNKPRSNSFDLSHERKMSIQMSNLYPIMVQEIVPGDKFRVSSEIMLRMAPMIAPVMHRVNVFTHFFFVPNRLTWNEWEDFITGGEQGDAAPVFPTLSLSQANSGHYGKGTLADYMGIPTDKPGAWSTNAAISALPFRAYQSIYNEYYRDQALTDKVEFGLGSDANADVVDLFKLRKRAWEKDYFTSALPYAQKGEPVNLPITPQYKDVSEVYDQNGSPSTAGSDLQVSSSQAPDLVAGAAHARIENLDEDAGMGVTINDLRQASRLQEWLEKNARAGSRYVESIRAHFGVRSKDARLQRPEYLGGGKQNMIISEVLSTIGTDSEADEFAPQGNMAGHGISVGSSNRFSQSFTEHGYVIGIMSVLPRTAYQNGLERMWTKQDRFDYYWPEFAQLGEQEIQQKELFLDLGSDAATNNATFGYQSRYAEYKYKQSSVHGDFRDNLKHWHMGRIFDVGSPPALNTSFVESDATDRIFAVTDGTTDLLYCQVFNNVKAIRPMPIFNNPKL